MQRKGEFPGAPDDYRATVYERDYEDHSFRVLYSTIADTIEDDEDLAELGAISQ